MYYNNDDITSSDSENDQSTITKKTTKQTKTTNNEDRLLKRKENDENEVKRESSVLLIQHLPIGFFEHQISNFFSQFCEILNVRVVRNPKTRKSRGIAFVEVADRETAEILIEEMDFYYLGRKTIRIQHSKLSRSKLFFGKSFYSKPPTSGDEVRKQNATSMIQRHIRRLDRLYTPEEITKKQQKMKAKQTKKQKNLKEKGINF